MTSGMFAKAGHVSRLCLQSTVIVLLVFSTALCQKRLVCPHGLLPCTCQVTSSGIRKALDIDCRAKGLASLPPLYVLRHHPVTKLDLSDNDIDTIPDDAFTGLHFVPLHITDKAEIVLSDNPVKHFSQDAFRDVKAYGLSLELTRIGLDKVPRQALLGLQSLIALHLDHNNISSIEANTFDGFNTLEILDLSGNPLQHLRRNSFKGLEQSLENLILKSIGMRTFPTGPFKKLANLHSLTLDGNHITKLPGNVFRDFETKDQGFILSLKDNKITFVDHKTFSMEGVNFRLYHVLLEGNQIEDISFLYEPCSLMFNPGNAFVFLDKNPIQCDCSFYHLTITGFYHLKGSCDSPTNRSGSSFYAAPDSKKTFHIYGDLGETSIAEDCKWSSYPMWDMSCLEIEKKSASTNGHDGPHLNCIVIFISILPLLLLSFM